MPHLIDKSALVAEIEKRIEKHRMVVSTCRKEEYEYFKGMLTAEETLFLFIDTLEVKEVQEEPYVMSDKGKFTTTTK